jgi:transposase
MYYDNNFKKSIIDLHTDYINNNQPVNLFIKLINKIFKISRSTFYSWLNNEDITNLKVKKNYKNNNINPTAEQIILLNKNKKIKIIKQELNKVNILLNSKSIIFVIKNNKEINFKPSTIKKNKIINLTEQNEKFINDNSNIKIKEIQKEFYNKFNLKVHEKQIVNVLHKNRKIVSSFYKRTQILEEYIIEKIKEKSIYTIAELKEKIKNEFKINVSLQFIYNIIKEKNYVYKKIKRINNPYPLEEQVKQLEKVKETHNIKNINNCVSLDEISVVINSTPRYGWFEKNKEPNYKIENPKITNKRYTILMACNNKQILNYTVCEQGIKTENFINFMKELNEKNNNTDVYYLMDNAVVHKTKKFNSYVKENKIKVVYNAPYHSETNPIENVFSMFRNKINRKNNNTIEMIKTITNEFIKEKNEEKLKNIFNHSVKMIENFINENK